MSKRFIFWEENFDFQIQTFILITPSFIKSRTVPQIGKLIKSVSEETRNAKIAFSNIV